VDRVRTTGFASSDGGAPRAGLLNGLRDRIQVAICDLRQLQYPVELRIGRPLPPTFIASNEPAEHPKPDRPSPDPTRLDQSIAKVAVCLWDIRRKLESNETAKQDRDLRKVNRRAEAAVEALEDLGVLIDDPIGRRYVPGSDGSMKPNFLPSTDVRSERIVETVSPIIYRDERLISRGEVFVAVPTPTHSAGLTTEQPTQGTNTADASNERGSQAPRATFAGRTASQSNTVSETSPRSTESTLQEDSNGASGNAVINDNDFERTRR
jgi:hypothetical protein